MKRWMLIVFGCLVVGLAMGGGALLAGDGAASEARPKPTVYEKDLVRLFESIPEEVIQKEGEYEWSNEKRMAFTNWFLSKKRGKEIMACGTFKLLGDKKTGVIEIPWRPKTVGPAISQVTCFLDLSSHPDIGHLKEGEQVWFIGVLDEFVMVNSGISKTKIDRPCSANLFFTFVNAGNLSEAKSTKSMRIAVTQPSSRPFTELKVKAPQDIFSAIPGEMLPGRGEINWTAEKRGAAQVWLNERLFQTKVTWTGTYHDSDDTSFVTIRPGFSQRRIKVDECVMIFEPDEKGDFPFKSNDKVTVTGVINDVFYISHHDATDGEIPATMFVQLIEYKVSMDSKP